MDAREMLRYIDRERYRLNKTQYDLSADLGRVGSYYSVIYYNVTSGKRDLLVSTLAELADAVGLEIHLRPKGTVDYVNETDRHLEVM